MNTFWAVHIPRFVIVYFILANLVAIILFPGGNHLDSTQVGYDFTRNFFSELGFYKTFSDDINFLSAFFFNSAMFLFVAQGFGFLFMPFFFKENKKAYIFAWLGAICIFLSTIFYAMVGLTPGDLYFNAHVFAVFTAFRLTLPGVLFLMLAFYFSKASNIYTIGAFLLLASVVAYIIFMGDMPQIDPVNDRENFVRFVSMDVLMLNVILQKLIVIAMLISMFMFTFGFQKLKQLS